ncbi:class I SAM-dependent methyltransferase [Actinoallomurus acaciae]|uniref:Class I SAM-dependent methyltransferase n=1 Tax=Actinoallomurus acaciae TaxID=502577 RepID=A0ABV5YPK7_9ACTN
MGASDRRERVRRSYDVVAEPYATGFRDELAHKPLDRALLNALLEQAGPGAPVADLGCGPGHVTGWLAAQGAAAVGVDLSGAMVELARKEHSAVGSRQGGAREFGVQGAAAAGVESSGAVVESARGEHPAVEFRQGDLLDLPARDGEFAAVVALYSIIHLTAAELPRAFQEIHRVLRPGGPVLVSFHIGSEVRHLTEWLGREVDIDFHFFAPGDVAEALDATGLTTYARLERVHHPEEVETRRAYLMARRR